MCQRAGERGLVEVAGEPLRPGITVGYHRDLPGGWSERLIAHEDQLFPVAESLGDRVAVLIEPLSVGVHAVLRAPPDPTEPVLVIGSGPIAFATLWALRALGHENAIVIQAKRERERTLAERLGATTAVMPGEEARTALLQTGAIAYRPLVSPEVYAGGGFPLIYDCVGSGRSVDQSLRYAAPGGRVILLGCAAVIRKIDLTLLWARELSIKGFVGYGLESWNGETLHTFAITQRLLQTAGPSVADMVTHVFPLDHYRTALAAARHHRRSDAIKVLITPTGSLPR
jgi:threonine dehydrogenase-like Zn-dependent dehydrogenase